MIKNINFKANIQENARDLVVSNQEDVKESVAYNIDVPADSANYATVNKVGGMTRKTANVARISTPKSGYFYDSNGTESEKDSRFIAFYALNVRENTTYSASCNLGLHSIWFSDDESPISEAPQTDHFTTPLGCTVLRVSVRNTSGVADASAFKWFMLNEGSTALPYEPYFEGLRSAKVTEVESVGVNLFDVSALSDTDKVKVVDGVIKVTTSNLDSSANTYKTFGELCPNLKVGDLVIVRAITTGKDKYIYLEKFGVVGFGNTFTVTEDVLTSNVYFYASGVSTTAEISEVMVSKDTNAPYTPYLHHTLPIPVEVRGSENLIPEKSVVIGKYWEINANGTVFQENLAGYMCASEPLLVKPNNIYYVSSKQDGTIIAWAVWFVDENYKALGRTEGWQGTGGTFTVPSNCRYALFTARYNKESYQNNIMINEGTTALPYEPYSTVKGLDGYGLGVSDTVYNYIDWEKKQFVKRVGKIVFDGTEYFTETYSEDLGKNAFSYSVTEIAFTNNVAPVGLGLSNIYAFNPESNDTIDTLRFGTDNGGLAWFYPSGYNTAAEWKAHLAELYAAGNPLTIVYAIANSVITDISSLITEDNFIGVEGNGTLTFKNAYEYAVPSEVTLYEGGNEIIGSKTFVGDLIGEAGRAKKATMAVYDESGNKIDETYLSKSGGTLGGQVVANASAVTALETKQVRNIYAGTSDLTAGSSALPTGDIYIVYE